MMSENNCEYTLGKVFDFLSNDLVETDKARVLDHLDDCQACKKEFTIESKISSLISNSSINAQADFASKMQSKLQSEI
jgi:hypothetical protein